MKKSRDFAILGVFSILMLASAAFAQTACPATMPAGTVCISQTAANIAAEDHRVRTAQESEIATLKQSLLDKDATAADIKKTAAANEADLKAALVKTQTDLATATGQVISLQAQTVRDAAIVDVLLKNSRAKCLPFSICIGH